MGGGDAAEFGSGQRVGEREARERDGRGALESEPVVDGLVKLWRLHLCESEQVDESEGSPPATCAGGGLEADVDGASFAGDRSRVDMLHGHTELASCLTELHVDHRPLVQRPLASSSYSRALSESPFGFRRPRAHPAALCR